MESNLGLWTNPIHQTNIKTKFSEFETSVCDTSITSLTQMKFKNVSQKSSSRSIVKDKKMYMHYTQGVWVGGMGESIPMGK